MPRRLAALLLLLWAGTDPVAIDLGRWARHLKHHGDWTSLDFRHPETGLFLAARAGTEDPQAGATLTLTMAPAVDCVVDTVLVFKDRVPARVDAEEAIQVALAADGAPPRVARARLVRVAGDVFFFVQLAGGLPVAGNRARLTVTLPDGRQAQFSLRGFEEARQAAFATCQSFLPR